MFVCTEDAADEDDEQIFRKKTFVIIGFNEQQTQELTAYIEEYGGQSSNTTIPFM